MSNMAGSPGSRPLEQLKVAELRDELKKRGLSIKGVKKELFERLEEFVKKEEQQENVDGEHEEATHEGAHKSDTADETEDVEEEAEALDGSKGEASKCDDTATACQNKTSTDTPLPMTEGSTPFSEEAHVSPAVSAPNEALGFNEEREQLCTAGVANMEKNNDLVSVDDAVCGNGDAKLLPEDVGNVAGVQEFHKDTSVVQHVESGNDEKNHGIVAPELERVDALPESGVATSVLENVATDVLAQPVSEIDNTALVIEASGRDCPMQNVESSNLKEDKLLVPDSATENFSSKADGDMSLVQPFTQASDTGEPVETLHEEVIAGVKMESLSSRSTASPETLEPHAGFKSEDLERHNTDERDSIINEEKSDVEVEVPAKQEIVNEDGFPLIINKEKSYVKVEVASKYESLSEVCLEKSAAKSEPMEIETRSEKRYEATRDVEMELEKNEEVIQQQSPSPEPQLKEVKLEVTSEDDYLKKSRGEENVHEVPDDRRKDGATSKVMEEEDSQARINLKRKDNEADVKQEPAKRVRRWNSGKEVVVEPVKPLTTDSMKEIMLPDSIEGSSAVTPRLTPKTVATSRALPAIVKVEPEPINNTRTVPPSTRSPSNSLKIDRFVRPFTLKAVKDLLAEFGQCVDFWMDQIKTHCYVTYSSVDEAVAARSGLYGRQWPSMVGNCLVAEFVDVNEVKFRSAGLAEKAQVAPVGGTMRVSNSTQVPPSRGGQTALSFRGDSNTSMASRFSKEVQPSPLPKKDPEPAVVTLEDLFFKTKAKPHIYYLPLTDEQVAEKIKKKQAVR